MLDGFPEETTSGEVVEAEVVLVVEDAEAGGFLGDTKEVVVGISSSLSIRGSPPIRGCLTASPDRLASSLWNKPQEAIKEGFNGPNAGEEAERETDEGEGGAGD